MQLAQQHISFNNQKQERESAMKLIASLESGINNKEVNELFNKHHVFTVDISDETITFYDEGGVFYKNQGTAESLINTETGAYGLLVMKDGVRIHIWSEYHLSLSQTEKKEEETKQCTPATAVPTDETDKEVQEIMDQFSEELGWDRCGEDVTVGWITILEATYYSDDERNDMRPYWTALVRDDRTGYMETVYDWEELREFVRIHR